MFRITVRIKPRSSRNEIKTQSSGELVAWVTDAPVNGKANQRLIELLANYFQCAKGRVKIVHGLKSKTKKVEIEK